MHFIQLVSKVRYMTEDELQNHLRSTLIDETSPWPYDPICEGDWKLFDKDEAVRILARLSAEQIARGENPIPFHARVKRLRGAILAIYPRFILIEGEAELMESSRPATFVCLFGVNGLRVFRWNASDIVQLNRKVSLNLNTRSEFQTYLSFYCAIAIGEEGRFRIAEPSDTLPWRNGAQDSQKVAAIEALEKLALDIGDNGTCQAKFTSLYGRNLVKTVFSIRQNGGVEITESEVLLKDLAVHSEAFFGPFRLYR